MNDGDDLTAGLVLARRDDDETSYFEAHCEGAAVISSAWTEGAKPKTSRKMRPGKDAASKELNKTLLKKRQEGFVFAASGDGAKRGALVYAGTATAFDVGRAGARLALATWTEAALDARVVEGATNERVGGHVVPWKASDDAFIDGILLPPGDERLVLGWSRCPGRKHTQHLVEQRGLEGGKARELASYKQYADSTFGTVPPQMDAAGRRMLVAQAGNTLAVVDVERLSTIRKVVPARHPEACHRAALSPSGKLLAALVGTEQGQGKLAGEIRVWEVEGGKEVARIAVADNCYMPRLGISADDRTVMITVGRECDGDNLLRSYGQGPVGYAIASGKPMFDLSRRKNARVWHRRLCWAFSPDGKVLAVGSREDDQIDLYDAKTFAARSPIPVQARSFERLAFSADGRVLYSGLAGGVGVVGAGLLEGRVIAG